MTADVSAANDASFASRAQARVSKILNRLRFIIIDRVLQALPGDQLSVTQEFSYKALAQHRTLLKLKALVFLLTIPSDPAKIIQPLACRSTPVLGDRKFPGPIPQDRVPGADNFNSACSALPED